MKKLKIASALSIIALIFLLTACIPKNFQYSPSVVKGTWVCEEKGISITWDDETGNSGTMFYNGQDIDIIGSFRINTDIFSIYGGDIIAVPGIIDHTVEGIEYCFRCDFYEGYFVAKPVKDYDIFRRGEELRFNHVETVDTPHS